MFSSILETNNDKFNGFSSQVCENINLVITEPPSACTVAHFKNDQQEKKCNKNKKQFDQDQEIFDNQEEENSFQFCPNNTKQVVKNVQEKDKTKYLLNGFSSQASEMRASDLNLMTERDIVDEFQFDYLSNIKNSIPSRKLGLTWNKNQFQENKNDYTINKEIQNSPKILQSKDQFYQQNYSTQPINKLDILTDQKKVQNHQQDRNLILTENSRQILKTEQKSKKIGLTANFNTQRKLLHLGQEEDCDLFDMKNKFEANPFQLMNIEENERLSSLGNNLDKIKQTKNQKPSLPKNQKSSRCSRLTSGSLKRNSSLNEQAKQNQKENLIPRYPQINISSIGQQNVPLQSSFLGNLNGINLQNLRENKNEDKFVEIQTQECGSLPRPTDKTNFNSFQLRSPIRTNSQNNRIGAFGNCYSATSGLRLPRNNLCSSQQKSLQNFQVTNYRDVHREMLVQKSLALEDELYSTQNTLRKKEGTYTMQIALLEQQVTQLQQELIWSIEREGKQKEVYDHILAAVNQLKQGEYSSDNSVDNNN